MDRRDFILTTGAVAGAAAAQAVVPARAGADQTNVAAPTLRGGGRTLTMAVAWPEFTAGFGASASRLATRIEAASGGHLRLDLRFGESWDPVRLVSGDVDIWHGTAHAHLGAERGFAYFAGLPFFCGLEPADLQAWLAVAGGQELWDDLSADHGFKALLAGHTGRAPGLWSTRQLETIGDLGNQGVYAPGLAGEILRDLGADVLAVEAWALPDAIASGRLGIVEWGGALASMSLGLPRVAKHLVGLGINTGGTGLSLSVRLPVWQGLTPGERAIIEACAAAEVQVALGEARAHEAIVREALVAAHGVVIDSLPGDVMLAVSAAADDRVASLGATSGTAQRIHASYMAFRKSVTGLDAPKRPLAVS